MGFIKSKNVEKPVFFHFLRRKTPFNVFCVAFRQISHLARSLARASTDVHFLALSRRKTRPLLELLAKNSLGTVLRRISADLAYARIINLIANKVAFALFLPEICKRRYKELYFRKIDFKRMS